MPNAAMAPTPAREPQVTQSLYQLTQAIEELEGATQTANERFGKAVRPTDPIGAGAAGKIPREGKAPLSDSIDLLTDRVRQAVASLHSLNERAEV